MDSDAYTDLSKSITVLDAILWMKSAMKDTTAETVHNCRVKAAFDNKQQGVSEEIMEPSLELKSDLEP